MRKFLDNVMRILSAITLAVMLVLVLWQVFTRYILNNSATWTEELTAYLFAWSTLFGASLVVGERGHMNIPVVMDRRSPHTQKIVGIFAEVIIFLFSAIILVYGGYSITKLAMGQMTSSLSVPIGIFYIPIFVTGVINMIYAILNIKDIVDGKIVFTQKSSVEESSTESALDSETEKYLGGDK
ncbi:TRAP transporter small permease [Anaerococcus sp. AGMB00486]|uniref:TRAP transporter small permease n=2 Tax=Anaerococcus TaxID=165779 RepID=A0ABX2NCF9_9FIRM|nr:MULTISPECIES: TRAP transporter small permease [Anaerococcus]MDY3007190.1 TRAP transporter small permease [Anaerococcus porci]MSS78423.1 TRAP transporter small permease [Anaerococcus porci]NVF12397.1 TRAP transporter small permease [Anaerococcus faecalis]